MPTLSLQNFTTLVQNMAAVVQGAAASLLNLTPGSVLLAILEASATAALWLQYLILQVLQVTRLSTSTGTAVDSFVGDFTLTRLPATDATGNVTFSRFTATSAATIPVGTTVVTGDMTQTFTVVANTGNTFFVAASNAYVIPATIGSASVPVQAVNAGTQGNVSAGAISLLGSPIPFVDTVTNPSAFTNGENAETDAALKARFVNFIASLSKATDEAVGAAVQSVQQGLTFTIQENISGGVFTPGNFVVTVDDGSGNPPTATLQNVQLAVNAVRPIGSTFAVFGPTVTTVNVALTLTVGPGFVKANLIGPVVTALTAFINTLPVGASLPFSQIFVQTFAVSPGITNVTNVTLNGGTADITVPQNGVIKAGTITVS